MFWNDISLSCYAIFSVCNNILELDQHFYCSFLVLQRIQRNSLEFRSPSRILQTFTLLTHSKTRLISIVSKPIKIVVVVVVFVVVIFVQKMVGQKNLGQKIFDLKFV